MSSYNDDIGDIFNRDNKISIDWEIPNYFSLSQKADDSYESQTFHFYHTTWCIGIYPNGQRWCQTVGSVGLYLRQVNPFSDGKDITVELGIKNHDGSVFDSCTATYCLDDRCHFSADGFMERSTLYRLKRTLTFLGSLTVFCVASISSATVVATQTTAVKGASSLCDDFRSLFVDGRNTDMVFNVDGEVVGAHRVILQARSPVFDAMFANNWKEETDGKVCITDCDFETFREFLLFLYTGKIDNVTSNNFAGLYSLADKYQVNDLKKHCFDFMKENITVDTVCDVIAMADRHEEEGLKRSAEKFLLRNIKTIIPTEKWKRFMTENKDLTVALLMKAIPDGGYTEYEMIRSGFVF